jgi:transketolase
LEAWRGGELPSDLVSLMPIFEEDSSVATRAANGSVLAALDASMPNLLGGSADLSGSNKTEIKGREAFQKDTYGGNYFFFGVREHAMASMCNGMQLYGGLRTYCGTFLVFSDYMRPAIRLSALMEQPVIYVLTHDSIGLGEDGPTHQPIEHFMALRAIPNCTFIRPADGPETAGAWVAALKNTSGPTLLALSRQNLPTLNSDTAEVVANVERGAYTVLDTEGAPDAIIMATGSEVMVAIEAAERLAEEGTKVRVVSMPSWELFEQQDIAYQHDVLPPAVTARVSVEAGITMGWHRWVGSSGACVGIDHFGASAPAEELFEQFGITAENVAAQVRQLLT